MHSVGLGLLFLLASCRAWSAFPTGSTSHSSLGGNVEHIPDNSAQCLVWLTLGDTLVGKQISPLPTPPKEPSQHTKDPCQCGMAPMESPVFIYTAPPID